MMYRMLARSFVFTLFAVLLLAGCSSDPGSSDNTTPQAPKNLAAVGLTSTTIMVQWTAADDSAQATGYRVEWLGSVQNDSGSVELDGSARSYTVTGAKLGQHYTFAVYARKGDNYSAGSTLDFDFTSVDHPAAPTDLKVAPTANGAIAINWTAPSGTIPTGYQVAWSSPDIADSGSADFGPVTTATIESLTAGRRYTIYVRAKQGASLSDPVTAMTAASAGYTKGTDQQVLRMYEKASTTHGSGLLLDASKGGPKIVSTATDPNLVQILWVIGKSNGAPGSYDTVIIGSGPAFPEYSTASQFDQNVFVSNDSYSATGLADFFVPGSLESLISTLNATAFSLPSTPSTANGVGFIVRTGAVGSYHYARVVVKNIGGSLVQGSAPDRYLEVEVAYQSTANLPYAKPAGVKWSPVAFPSRPR